MLKYPLTLLPAKPTIPVSKGAVSRVYYIVSLSCGGEREFISMRISPLPPALLVTIVILLVPALTFALSSSKVTLNFMCPCGSCDEALSTCECPHSDGFRSEIAGMVGRGFSEEQIIQDFKGRFGSSVLVVNAALAPNSTGGSFDKKTIGFILLLGSFGLVAFSLGKFMKASPSPAPARRKKRRNSEPPAKQARGKGKREKSPQKGFNEGVDDELLDDYDYEERGACGGV